ncbi:MAG: M20/M25/M40 family metallo-hydrolase [Acidimicrobiales bacterium]|jgi:acetylornithine deacetylase/succinyl-diaminopimelate desuccinylase-like protein
MTADEAVIGEATELLQRLIQNHCVNDGTAASGGEVRNSELLAHYLIGAGIELERFESAPGRESLVARIDGSDPTAPSLCLMGHTDVVPVNPAGWHEDPFGGELINGEVWGRGAIDMLNITATMAVAFKRLVHSGFRPRGSLTYFAVADEEAGGRLGAEWMVDNHWDAVASDYVLTEIGGWSDLPGDGSRRIVVNVAEKGLAWRRLTVKGTPGHGSMPYRTDNALVTAAEVVKRISDYRPAPWVGDLWLEQLAGLDLPESTKRALSDPATLDDALAELPAALARGCHAVTHTTFSPNVAHGGEKTNTIPDHVVLEVDVRTLAGQTPEEVDGHLRTALGDLANRVEISSLQQYSSTRSGTDNRLWEALGHQVDAVYPGAQLSPAILVGATDARFFRDKGSVAMGAALYSPEVTFETFAGRFHGNDERVDIASLGLSTELWTGVVKELLG